VCGGCYVFNFLKLSYIHISIVYILYSVPMSAMNVFIGLYFRIQFSVSDLGSGPIVSTITLSKALCGA